jgi:transposase
LFKNARIYAGRTGAPDESGAKRREQSLAKAGNARFRRGMIQLAWRFLLFQKIQRTGAAVPGPHRRCILAAIGAVALLMR